MADVVSSLSCCSGPQAVQSPPSCAYPNSTLGKTSALDSCSCTVYCWCVPIVARFTAGHNRLFRPEGHAGVCRDYWHYCHAGLVETVVCVPPPRG